MTANSNKKTKRVSKGIGKSKYAFLFASPVAIFVAVLVMVGTASAAVVISYQSIVKPTEEVKEEPESKPEKVNEPTVDPSKAKDEGEEPGFILDGVEASDMLNTIEKHQSTKNTGYSMTAEQVKRSESKEAIDGRLKSLGLDWYRLSGQPGDYRVDIKHTINLSQVACDDYPEQSDTAKKRDLAGDYLINHMPPSLTSGTITFTIVGDTITPKQTFYWDHGTSWVRWTEDGGSYMTCAPLETRG